jgi:hypothetical protein
VEEDDGQDGNRAQALDVGAEAASVPFVGRA